MDPEKAVIYESKVKTLIVGCGAAGLKAAVTLKSFGEEDLLLVAEGLSKGTSRNTGSDKQTYYKLSLAGDVPDSVRAMADDLFSGDAVDGDHALCEAALSVRCFYHLKEAGVPFPENEFGESIGYRTDHDTRGRASSAGPYTSKMMTEALFREAQSQRVPMRDGWQLVRIFTDEGQVSGALFFSVPDSTEEHARFYLVRCEHLVLATGGPAAMYRDSVYPETQTGASGIAFSAGVRGRNLTEWQFGMSSVTPRWNVSGSYMQVLPRLVSTDPEGNDPYEFLCDYYDDSGKLLEDTFRKGYEWPFDAGKCSGGSSLIDLLVFHETVIKGRRVFLDYRKDPSALTEGDGPADMMPEASFPKLLQDRLPKEAYSYLEKADALVKSPVSRLKRLNEPAYRLYLDHGTDLEKEMLEIRVSAQHNNGGLSVDSYWQTNVRGIYAVGEAACTHGVRRPGGSALNAGQVGGYRAAEAIVYSKNEVVSAGDLRREAQAFIRMICLSPEDRLDVLLAQAKERMSAAGGLLRNEKMLLDTLRETDRLLQSFFMETHSSSVHRLYKLFLLYDILLSQKVYLSAMLDYIRKGGGSRGSALYTGDGGIQPHPGLPAEYCFIPGGEGLHGNTQEISLDGTFCRTFWRSVRPIPDAGLFFEAEWKKFRERTERPAGQERRMKYNKKREADMDQYVYKTLRECPGRKDDAAMWFNEKWGVPKSEYLRCMDAYLGGETEYGWYLALDGERIIGGMGVIDNDFHDRKDLAPNVCAVYTEEEYRGQGIAGRLLDMVVQDMRSKGISPLYLVTDHTGFYERYGWEFFSYAQGDGQPDMTRVYIHR